MQGLVSGFTLFDLEACNSSGSWFFALQRTSVAGAIDKLSVENIMLQRCNFGYCVLIYLDESRANDMVLGRSQRLKHDLK